MKSRIFFLFIILVWPGIPSRGQESHPKTVISGVVSDMNNSPVAGAVILADKENTGVVSGKDGRFKIKLNKEVKSIGAYSSGYGSAEVACEGTSTVHIVLNGSLTIDLPVQNADTTVHAGLSPAARKKNKASKPVQKEVAESRYASYSDIYEVIRTLPGVQVTGKRIQISGITSVNLNNEPLFVVNGIEVSSIDHINPGLIKSIRVLKGPDATIYGSRAVGGVIQIYLIGTERK